MRYNISKPSAPKMPKFGKGTECIKILLSQVSKDVQEPIVPMLFPILGAHISGAEFQYPDLTWKEPCGMMAHLVAESGGNKGQLSYLVEALCRDFRQHDEIELQKLVGWQKTVKSKGSAKDRPVRPDVAFWFPPSDVTNPAFIQNAMALENLGGRTQYLNMPEVEMADKMCGGHRQVSQTIRNIYDRQRAGALRATADGVTGNPILRVNITFSSTPEAARSFYKKDMTNGFFGRIPFAYKARGERKGKIPRQGCYDKGFLKKLDEYIMRLDNCKGKFIVKQLNKIADQLAEEMAQLADLADDDMLFELSHRSIFAAWKKAATLWILNDQNYTRSIGEYMIWFCYYDLWSKVHVFGDMFKLDDATSEVTRKSGPANMLDSLETTFNEQQLEALRLQLGKSKEGTKHLLNVWKYRKFITYNAETGLYSKTDEYLNR